MIRFLQIAFVLIAYSAVVMAQIAVKLGADTTICPGECVTLDPGNIGTDYLWSTGDTTQAITYCAAQSTTIVLTVFDTNGGTGADTIEILMTPNCDLVWPGDADNSGSADVFDILPIGQYFGFTGLLRLNASTQWVGQPSIDWGGTAVLDYKYADCNGNGTIDLTDFDAIVQNYGLTHPKQQGPLSGLPGEPILMIDIVQDTVQEGDTLLVKIRTEDTTTVSSLYGIAMSIAYDAQYVDTSIAAVADYSNCYLAQDGAAIYSLDKNFFEYGKLDLGITRMNQVNMPGFGKLAHVSFILIDDIAGKTGDAVTMRFFFTQTRGDRADGVQQEFELIGDSVVIVKRLTGGIDVIEPLVATRLYPNPANDMLMLELAGIAGTTEVTVYDMLGKPVANTSAEHAASIKFDTSTWPGGSYIVQMKNKGATATKRIMILH